VDAPGAGGAGALSLLTVTGNRYCCRPIARQAHAPPRHAKAPARRVCGALPARGNHLFPGDLLACLPRARPRLLLRSSTPWIQFHQPWLAAKPPQTHRCQPEADRDQQLFPELKGLRREGTTQQLSEEG